MFSAIAWKEAEANKLVHPNQVYVDADGAGDFETISEALTYVSGQSPSPTNGFEVIVFPGNYSENNNGGVIVIPGYTRLKGTSRNAVLVSPTDPAIDLFALSNTNSEIECISISGVTTAACIIDTHGGGNTFVKDVSVSSAQTGFSKQSSGTCYIEEFYVLAGVGTYGYEQPLGGGSTFIKNSVMQMGIGATGVYITRGTHYLDSVTVSFATTGFHSEIASGTAGGFIMQNCITANCLTAGLRCGGLGFTITQCNACIFISFSGGFSVQQDTSAARVNVSNSLLQADRLSFTSDAVVNLDFTDYSTSFSSGALLENNGVRQKRREFSASGQTRGSDRICAITAGGLAMTHPNAAGQSQYYPIRQTYVDETGLGTSTVAPPGGSTLDGGVAAVAIPATGGLHIYGYGSTWFTA